MGLDVDVPVKFAVQMSTRRDLTSPGKQYISYLQHEKQRRLDALRSSAPVTPRTAAAATGEQDTWSASESPWQTRSLSARQLAARSVESDAALRHSSIERQARRDQRAAISAMDAAALRGAPFDQVHQVPSGQGHHALEPDELRHQGVPTSPSQLRTYNLESDELHSGPIDRKVHQVPAGQDQQRAYEKEIAVGLEAELQGVFSRIGEFP